MNIDLTSWACSALQGLLRKLGAGFDDIVPSGGLSSAQLKVHPPSYTPEQEIKPLMLHKDRLHISLHTCRIRPVSPRPLPGQT